jgi:hypothetical protein
MKKLFPFLSILLALHVHAQSDVIVLEKKGVNVKTYATGMDINMQTIYNQWFTGSIEAIRHDSLFVNGIAFHYKEIAAIRMERKKLDYETDGSLLIIAGGGVLLLGAVNGLYRHDQAKTWYTTGSFITAAALLATGFFIKGSRIKKYQLGRKFTLQYLALGADKK